MARCRLCGEKVKITKHHFFWPQARFDLPVFRMIHVKLCDACHCAYHHFYNVHCRSGYDCFGCRYRKVCCYKSLRRFMSVALKGKLSFSFPGREL